MKKGKNIVLIHGWGANVNKLKPLKKELKELGWNAFLPKLPGFDLKEPNSIWGNDEYADFVFNSAQKYFNSNSFYVFGHSFGGGLAIKLAVRENSNIKGIVLCATRGISRGKSVKRLFFYILAKFGKLLVVFPPLANRFRKILYKLAREHDYEKTSGIMKEVFKKVISENLKSDLKFIKIPVLVLWGAQDKTTPIEDAYIINNTVKNSKLIVYDDQKHSLPYVKYKELAKKINLWEKNLK